MNLTAFFIEFMYNGFSYALGGIYRHPSGNLAHIISLLETILTKLDGRKTSFWLDTWILILKTHQWTYCVVLVHYDVIPVFALCNAAYSYHPIFTNLYWLYFYEKLAQEKIIITLRGMFYCDISDQLPCFISLQYASNSSTGDRAMARIFCARSYSKFV